MCFRFDALWFALSCFVLFVFALLRLVCVRCFALLVLLEVVVLYCGALELLVSCVLLVSLELQGLWSFLVLGVVYCVWG